jgi:hypothetical protein
VGFPALAEELFVEGAAGEAGGKGLGVDADDRRRKAGGDQLAGHRRRRLRSDGEDAEAVSVGELALPIGAHLI